LKRFPASGELANPAEIVLALIPEVRLELETANQSVTGGVHPIRNQHVLRPQQVLPLPKAVSLSKELLSRLLERPLARQIF
jgi:hypothetical protein